MAADAELGLIDLAAGQRSGPALARARHVVGMHDRGPGVGPVQRSVRQTRIGIDLGIEPIQRSVRPAGPDLVRRGLGEDAELGLAVAQGRLALGALGGHPHPLGDIAHQAQIAVAVMARRLMVDEHHGHHPALLHQGHVDEGSGADPLQHLRRRGRAGVQRDIGDGHRLAALDVLDVGAMLAEGQGAGDAADPRLVEVALDGDGLGDGVHRAVTGPADPHGLGQDARRRQGDLAGVGQVADGVVQLQQGRLARLALFSLGDVVEQDGDLIGARLPDPQGLHVVPSTEDVGRILEPHRLSVARHPAVQIEPVLLQPRRDLADPFAVGVGQARHVLEGFVALHDLVIDRPIRRVELHLDDAEPGRHGREQGAVSRLAQRQGLVGPHPFGDVGALDENAPDPTVLGLHRLEDEIQIALLDRPVRRRLHGVEGAFGVVGQTGAIHGVQQRQISLIHRILQHVGQGAARHGPMADQRLIVRIGQFEAMFRPDQQRHEPWRVGEHLRQLGAVKSDGGAFGDSDGQAFSSESDVCDHRTPSR